MNLDINLSDIDFENLGGMPLAVKAVMIAGAFVVILLLGFFLDTKRQINTIDTLVRKETTLRQDFEIKQRQAENLDAYRLQMEQINERFGELLRQLPEKTEVPGLVEDISNQGLSSGLNFKSIRLQPEQARDFYVELPIEVSVFGKYHEFGNFVSQISALPRIVTLHDFTISPIPENSSGLLQMDVIAKTYRYALEEKK